MSKKSKDAAKALKRARKGQPKKLKKQKPPKQKCCVSRPRCKRCPLRMLAEGTLPAGYAVRHRKLVDLDKKAKRKRDKNADTRQRAA